MSTLATVIGRGTLAARPAASSPGRLYFVTDTSTLYRDNGASWDSVEGAGGLADMGTVTYLDFATAAAPANPAAGKVRVYSKTGDTLAERTSGGVETVFGAGGGGTSPFLLDSVALDATYGTALTGTSLDALLTRLGVDADTEEFNANGVRTPVDFATIPAGGFGYYETPASMPAYMEIVWKGAFYGGDADDMGAGPFFVTAAGAGLGAAHQSGNFSLWSMVSGAFSGTSSNLGGRSARAASQGALQWIRLIRIVADGLTMFCAQFSMDGNKWSDQVGLIDTTAVTRVGYGIVRSSAGGGGRQLMAFRFNPIAKSLGNNLLRVPTSGTVTASASSSYPGFSAASAFDGNTATDWASNGYLAGQSITGTFSVAQTGNLVLLVPRTSDTWGYGYVEFSSGKRVPTGFISTPNVRNHITAIRLDAAETTTYVKVVSTSGGGTNPGFREIQFFNAT